MRILFCKPDNSADNRASYVHRSFREIDIAPLQTKQFALTQAGRCGEQHQGTFSIRETIRQGPDLRWSEDARRFLALRTLPNQMNRIAIEQFISAGMVEQNGHHTPDLRATTLRKG